MDKILKKTYTLVSVMLCIIIASLSKNVYASGLTNPNDLIKVNNHTITTTTTISQVNSMFGTPVEVTDCAFGGKAYSYTDDGYNWYLHIETNAEGKIVGYGAINGNFVARRYAYNDVYNSTYWTLSGTIVCEFNPQYIYGIYEYNTTNADVNTYWKNYLADSSTYLYNLQKHTIIVSKVLAKKQGYNCPQTYSSEDVFYMNELLKENGSNYADYATNNGKSKSIVSIYTRNSSIYEDLFNPIKLGEITENYEYAESYKYLLYDIEITDANSKKYQSRTIYINPDFLEERKKVSLNSEEQNRLEQVKQLFKDFTAHASSFSNIYDEEPVYDSLPLKAGKYNKNALLAATDWLNIARVGLGLGKVELNDEFADCAQHKAVLVYYANSNDYYADHYMPKPEGVEDDFYNKAQNHMNENLYMGTIQSSIDYALNDSYGDPTECGHRYNLLDPEYTDWGVGSVGDGLFGGQGCHKFGGYRAYTGDLVAWPSNGIFPLELVSRGIGNWTAQFYNNYEVTPNTTVTIECLNTNAKYDITSSGNSKYLKVTGNNLVTFRDDNIVYENGDVFKITLHNVKNTNTNSLQDYTYRSVFYSDSMSGTQATDINLSTTDVKMSVGQSIKITAKVMPEDATNKLIKFKSNSTNVVEVIQNGTLVAKSSGVTTVTVKCGDVIKTINVTVDGILKGDMNKDGSVNSVDAALVLDRYTNKDATAEDIAIGDMDNKGDLNATDAAVIIDIYSNNAGK